MKKTLLILALMMGVTLSAVAQSVILTFDENGYSSAGFQSRLFLDSNPDGNAPAGGITTLDYLYPIGANNDHVQLGWLVIVDPNDGISDLVRFDSSTQVGNSYYQQIFFYSSDHDGDLADNFPSSAVVNQIIAGGQLGNTVTIQEDAAGNAYYTPVSSLQPGFHLIGSTPYSYVFISAVPEPTSVAMLGSALALLALNKRLAR